MHVPESVGRASTCEPRSSQLRRRWPARAGPPRRRAHSRRCRQRCAHGSARICPSRRGSSERLGERLGLVQVVDSRLGFARARRATARKLEPQVDGLLAGRAARRQVPERLERLLEVGHRLAVRRARRRLRARPAAGRRPPCSHTSPRTRMVGEPLDVLGQAVGVQRLDRLHDPRVQRAPPLLEQAAVGDLVGERVLERVLQVREQARLVQELRRLQPRQALAQRRPRAARRSPAAAGRARPCRSPRPPGAAACPRARAGRCARPAPPAPSPAPACSRAACASR